MNERHKWLLDKYFEALADPNCAGMLIITPRGNYALKEAVRERVNNMEYLVIGHPSTGKTVHLRPQPNGKQGFELPNRPSDIIDKIKATMQELRSVTAEVKNSKKTFDQFEAQKQRQRGKFVTKKFRR